eukprot:136992-Rhodomonas_salina.2
MISWQQQDADVRICQRVAMRWGRGGGYPELEDLMQANRPERVAPGVHMLLDIGREKVSR